MTPKFLMTAVILSFNCVILMVKFGYFQFYGPHQTLTRLLPQLNASSSPRIGKCTILYNRDSASYDKALRKHADHCNLHGYAFHLLHHTMLDDVWTKPAYVLSLLLSELEKPADDRLEWLMWVDADTVVMNTLVPLSIFLPPAEEEEINFLVTSDFNGLNNGVFFTRVSVLSVELFSAIVSYRYYYPHEDLIFRDQSAMGKILNEPEFSSKTKFVPQHWFNAYSTPTPEHSNDDGKIRYGGFLVHFAGTDNRENKMEQWLARADEESEQWMLPMNNTFYEDEIPRFWTSQQSYV
ncbi:uncharacterized protein PV06_11925 [Exophiala oligosperma]|uniref:Galactosyl transferase GMA12/MNN10 family protein n=1 Tax=Exophiala oligosperma TaxID=215243 RepID=A0A0D2DJ44_9EURO|nr:uncharacterized protein PV06_11925 [Exophiala oligosperma]KIW35734.1 hypothetical protein PV06_11925 [Exophiala oligosperma]